MVNEKKNIQEPQFEEIGRLLGGLKRVAAPTDFDFHVRARIAKGRPAEPRRSWLPVSLAYGAPLVLLLAVGGYVGFKTAYTADPGVVATVPAEAAPQPVVPVTEAVTPRPEVVADPASKQTVAEVKPPDASNKVVKTGQKTPVDGNTKSEPGGGSYDTAVRGSKTITQPDVDDNEPAPVKKVIVPVSQFLSSAGVNASGGKIVSVSGAAASAGLKAGDVIQGVNVQTGTVRVSRDGKTVTVTIK